MKTERSQELLARANKVIPEQTFTFAKAAHNYPVGSPLYVKSAQGCELIDVDGNRLLDYTMALGPMILGYSYPRIVKAVARQLELGTVYSLPHEIEVELAEEMVRTIPCAEKVRFYKNGADVTNMAIRVARSATGRRHVLQSGYHGHGDWYAFLLREKGVLAETKLYTHPFPYNDFPAVAKLVDSFDGDVAAIILETAFEAPRGTFLQDVRDLCTKRGIALIFDEMWTGFRFRLGGFQEYSGVTPDLATFSKAMANGFPIAALTGNASLMDEFKNVWGFTTFAGETLSMRAALETIAELRERPVYEHTWGLGATLRAGLQKAIDAQGFGGALVLEGYDCRFRLVAKTNPNDVKAHIQKQFLADNILWNMQFVMSYSHQPEHVERTVASFARALETLPRA
jgi:glutamate-1-semialdehyde aminotransferase